MGLTDGKVAFVTGGARGLGRAIAIRLATEGADIALFDICRDVEGLGYSLSDLAELEATAGEVRAAGRRVLTLAGDVRRAADMKAAIERTVGDLGGLDIVVANAGVLTVGYAWELSEDEWDAVIGVNLTGAWITAKYSIPRLMERPAGRLIFISSAAGLAGRSKLAHYCASKWGVMGMMKSLAIDLAPYRITVNVVCPATVQTGMNSKTAEKLGISFDEFVRNWSKLQLIHELIQPEDVAAAVAWIASDQARYVTGHALPVTAGASM